MFRSLTSFFGIVSVLIVVLVSNSHQTFAQSLDQLDRKTLKRVTRDPVKLANHLTEGMSGEKEKVTAIYEWIIGSIKYDVKLTEKAKLNKNQETDKVLRSKKAVCYGYSDLFQTMCEAVGIKSVILTGYVLNEDFREGKYLHIDYHAWNAVKIDGTWYLCDATWDAGHMGMVGSKFIKWFYRVFRKKKKDEYPKNKFRYVQNATKDHFLVSSDTFALRHLPVLPMWQLRDRIITMEQFEKGPDSLREWYKKEEGEKQNYKLAIDDFEELKEEEKPIFEAEEAFKFNPRNATFKVSKYAGYLTILGEKQVQKALKNSLVARKDLAVFLMDKNDTVKKYLKKAEKEEKNAFKNNNKVEKAYFKQIKGTTKSLDKSLKALEKKVKKSKSTIVKTTDSFKGIIKDNEDVEYSVTLNLNKNFHGIQNKEEVVMLKELRARRDSLNDVLNSKANNDQLNDLARSIQLALEYTKYNLSVIKINNHIIDDVVAEIYFMQDSLLEAAKTVAQSKLIEETFNKNFINSCKGLLSAYKNLERIFKTYEGKNYEKLRLEIEQEMTEVTRIMLSYANKGVHYNRGYTGNISNLESLILSIRQAQKNQIAAEELRESEIEQREELRNEKANKLYEEIEKLLKASEKFVKDHKKLLS